MLIQYDTIKWMKTAVDLIVGTHHPHVFGVQQAHPQRNKNMPKSRGTWQVQWSSTAEHPPEDLRRSPPNMGTLDKFSMAMNLSSKLVGA